MESHTVAGVPSRNLRSRELQRLVRTEWEQQRYFPLQLATELSRQFATHGLQFFKVNKTFTHVSVARPQFLDLETTPVSENIKRIIAHINAHPKCSRRQLIETLAPSPPQPAVIEIKPETEAPGSACRLQAAGAEGPPEGGTPNVPAATAEPTPEQNAIIADLHWLVHQGHVIEFADGRLETAKKPAPRPPKPEKKPAEEKPVAEGEAALSTTEPVSPGGSCRCDRRAEIQAPAETPAPAAESVAERAPATLPPMKRPRRRLSRRRDDCTGAVELYETCSVFHAQIEARLNVAPSYKFLASFNSTALLTLPMPFSKLGLAPAVLEGVRAAGYITPTPIQLRAIPLVLAGRDVIGSAQTGTGKTAAFALPILSKLGQHAPGPRALILEPTRELAAQVETAFHDYARFTNLKTTVVFGGVGYGRQNDELRAGTDIVVATPGRLLDHLERGTVRLDKVQFLVLDEADRMLDMGFLPDVRRIVERCPRQRHTSLFSATIPPQIETLIQWAMKNPETIEIGARRTPAETVKHVIYPVADSQKSDLLLELLKRVNYNSVLVFCRTKHGADRIAGLLKRNNHAVAVLHSNRTQREREQALKGFRDGRFEVLVATDIAARGLDIADVSHVINYDVPQHPEDYIHRIGRTGRAEHSGDAFTIMTAEDASHVFAIERFISQKIPRVKLENFDYKYTMLFEEGKARPAQRRFPRQSPRRARPRRLPLRHGQTEKVTTGTELALRC